MKQAAHSSKTTMAIARDTQSLFFIAGCQNQMLKGISRMPITTQMAPSTLLIVLIISICALWC